MLSLLSLLYQSGTSAPLPLVTAFIARAYLAGWSLLKSRLGSMVGLNPQCSHPVETIMINAHSNQRKALSSEQMEVYWVDNFLFEGWVWMDLTMILPFAFNAVETVVQAY